MAKKQFGPERIATNLRQIEVLMGEGQSLQQALRQAGTMALSHFANTSS